MVKYDPDVDYPASDVFARADSDRPGPKPYVEWEFQTGQYRGERIFDVIRRDGGYIGDLLKHLLRRETAPGLVKAIETLADDYAGEIPHEGLTPPKLAFTTGPHMCESVDDVLRSDEGMYVMNLIYLLQETGRDDDLKEKLEILHDQVMDAVNLPIVEEESRQFSLILVD